MTIKKAISKLNKLHSMLSDDNQLALETLFEAAKDQNTGTYECFHCGQRAVIWGADFDFDDYGLEGEGIIHTCHCANCGAEIEYRISLGGEEDG